MKLALRTLVALLILVLAAGLVFYFNPLWVNDQLTRLHLWREGVKSDYVEAGAYRLHYFEAGSGTPLVLVHGLGARGEDWQNMIPAMAVRGYHVYAPDLPGYGRSPRPDASYTISMEEAAAVDFMQSMHLTHADVGGWSMGGWVSMKLALDHPELVNRLVVYDSAGIYFPANFGAELFVPTTSEGLTHLMQILSPHPRPMPQFVERAVLRKLADNSWVIQRSMAAMTNGRDLLDFRLHQMQPPMLIVWGSADQLIPLDVGRKIHESVPGSVLNVVEGCGHLAPLECSQPIVEATDAFLKSQPPMQGGERTIASR